MRTTLGRYLHWLYSHSRGVRTSVTMNIVLGLVSQVFNFAFIYYCKSAIDTASHAREGDLGMLALVLVGIGVVRISIQAVNGRLQSLAAARLNYVVRRLVYGHILHSTWMGKDRHSGDTLNRLESDVTTVVDVVTSDVPEFVVTSVQFVGALVFLCVLDWRFALALVIFTPGMVMLSRVFFRRMRVMTRGIRDTESAVQAHLQESLQHRTVIQSLERVGMMTDRLDELQAVEYGQVKDRTRFNIFTRTIVTAMMTFGYTGAFLWGAYGIWKGVATFGTMTAFLQLVGQLQRPTLSLTKQVPAFVNAMTSIDRLMELEQAPKEEEGEPVVLPSPVGVRLVDVSFTYPDGDREVLSEVSHDFEPGSRTAILGPTGVGKSTLIRLMLALLRPSEGRVEVYSPGSGPVAVSPRTRANMVYVPQGNTLLSGSVRQNLLLGDPLATEERLREVIGVACAEFVYDLPEGLDTVIGERATGLSEGQAQRIAIARGLLRPGSVLLLDELSSSLDPATEERLVGNLVKATSGKTLIFITHRTRIADFCEKTFTL